MMAEWFIFGAVVFIGWALSHDIAKARGTLIALNQTLTALKADVAAIRDQVAPSAEDLQSL